MDDENTWESDSFLDLEIEVWESTFCHVVN